MFFILTPHLCVCIEGDSAYPLEPYLMTPLSVATTAAERAYNDAHAKTRVVIERSFGLLKSRFRCLDKSGGTLLYSAEKACQLVTACAVLHNFAISRRIPATVDAAVVDRDAAIQPVTVAAGQGSQGTAGVNLRRALIQQLAGH